MIDFFIRNIADDLRMLHDTNYFLQKSFSLTFCQRVHEFANKHQLEFQFKKKKLKIQKMPEDYRLFIL